MFLHVPQSLVKSHRPVWNSEGAYAPGWLVTAIIRIKVCLQDEKELHSSATDVGSHHYSFAEELQSILRSLFFGGRLYFITQITINYSSLEDQTLWRGNISYPFGISSQAVIRR